jgi:hypothetical protein
MLQFIIPIAIVGSYFLLRAIYDKNRDPNKDRATFLGHVAEIRDLINRCTSMAEWETLDHEIDWLESTWGDRIDDQLMLQETGKLYTKWLDKRGQFTTKKTA